MTVAFEIVLPLFWRKPGTGRDWGRDRFWLVTVWHVDPETDGSDDSCDWFGRRIGKADRALAHRLIEDPDDNLRHWFPGLSQEDAIYRIKRIFGCLRCRERRWWRHPKWHFWHWKIQIHPLQALKRWLWSRCAKCGRRFPWGYAPISAGWGGGGPRWFRGEKDVYHHECHGAGPAVEVRE